MAWKFVGGLVGGIAVSAVVWPVMNRAGMAMELALLLLPGKAMVGAAFIAFPRFKPVGIGVLVSLAVGCFIFFSTVCGG